MNTPFVHPNEEKHMLNTLGTDGWSYDEKDDGDEYDYFEGKNDKKPKMYKNTENTTL